MYPEISPSEEAKWCRTFLIFSNNLEQGLCANCLLQWLWAPAAKPCPGIVQGKSLLERAIIMPGNITGGNDDVPVPGNVPKHAPLHWDGCTPCHLSLGGTLLLTSCAKPALIWLSFSKFFFLQWPRSHLKGYESHLSQSECQAMWVQGLFLLPSGNIEEVRERENSHHENIFT